MCLMMEMSALRAPGPIAKLRLTLPKVKRSGCLKLEVSKNVSPRTLLRQAELPRKSPSICARIHAAVGYTLPTLPKKAESGGPVRASMIVPRVQPPANWLMIPLLDLRARSGPNGMSHTVLTM